MASVRMKFFMMLLIVGLVEIEEAELPCSKRESTGE
jgi:hypothetical protein